MIIQVDQEALSELSPPLRRALDDTLYKNEELLWFDHPNSFISKRFVKWIWLLGCSVAVVLAAATLVTAALRLYYKNDIYGNKPFFISLLIALLLSAGIIFFTYVLARICAFFDGKKSLYVLTGARAIVISPRPFSSTCQSTCYNLDDKLVKKVKIRGDEGDVVFEEQKVEKDYYISEKGFIRCPNAKSVAEYIHNVTHQFPEKESE